MAQLKVKNVGQDVNKAELCSIMGVTPPTVDGWVRNGCPIKKKGSRGVAATLNTADVMTWLRDKAREEASGTTLADESELKRRKLSAETAMVELELAKARGLVAPLDQVEKMVARAFAEVRAGMRNIPGRVVSTLIGETNERQFKRVMLEEIDQVLEAMANADLADAEEEDEEEDEQL